MSTFKNPVGPQPPQVYWRRRAMLAAGVLVVLIVIILIVVRPGPGGGASGDPSPTPSDTVASDPAATPSADPAATAPAADATADPDAPTPSAATGDAKACSPSAITLKPVTDKSSYTATELPQISMSITNTGKTDCVINLGSNQQKLVITSGQDQYWSSKDCQQNGTEQDVTLTAGQTLSTPPIAWDRTRSSADTCTAANRAPVTAGGASYRLTVSVGDITSTDTRQMILN